MQEQRLQIVVLGLSITSSWANGHASTFRALVRELAERGHEVLFLERDLPWHAAHRDLPHPPGCRTELYGSLPELFDRFSARVRQADLVVVGSFVPEGKQVCRWVHGLARSGITAFYDLDTPITQARLARGDDEYLAAEQIPGFDLYFTTSGGPTLARLEQRLGARRAVALYCTVDLEHYFPDEQETIRWDLGHIGTYSVDRRARLEELLLSPAMRWPAGRFVVAGPMYPDASPWPDNVRRIPHVPGTLHRSFYCGQRFTLHVTRQPQRQAGFTPSVRLFEAAACGVPILSDAWPGLEAFFEPGREVLVVERSTDVLELLRRLPERLRWTIGQRARRRVLAEHTPTQRVSTLLAEVSRAWEGRTRVVARNAGPGAGERALEQVKRDAVGEGPAASPPGKLSAG